jgi:hypothetical protein
VARLALAQRAGQFQLAAGDLFEQAPWPPPSAGTSAPEHGGEVRLDHQAAAQLLHHDEHVDGVAVEAAVRFRHRQRRQAQFGQRGPGPVRGAGAESTIARRASKL